MVLSSKKVLSYVVVFLAFFSNIFTLEDTYLEEIALQDAQTKIEVTQIDFNDEFAQRLLTTIDKTVLIESQPTWWRKTKHQCALNGITGPVTHSLRTLSPFFLYVYGKMFDQHPSLFLNHNNAPKLHALVQKIATSLKISVPTIILHRNTKSYDTKAEKINKSTAILFIEEGLLTLLNANEFAAIVTRELLATIKGKTYSQTAAQYATAGTSLALIYKMITKLYGNFEIEQIKGYSTGILMFLSIGGFHLLDTFLSRLQVRKIDYLTIKQTQDANSLLSAFKKLESKQNEYQKEYERLQEIVSQKIPEKLSAFKANLLKGQISWLLTGKELSQYFSTESILARKESFRSRIKKIEKMITTEELK